MGLTAGEQHRLYLRFDGCQRVFGPDRDGEKGEEWGGGGGELRIRGKQEGEGNGEQ